jgi:hypothetical protein
VCEETTVVPSFKILFVERHTTKKKEDGKPKISGEKNGILLSRFSRLISV